MLNSPTCKLQTAERKTHDNKSSTAAAVITTGSTAAAVITTWATAAAVITTWTTAAAVITA